MLVIIGMGAPSVLLFISFLGIGRSLFSPRSLLGLIISGGGILPDYVVGCDLIQLGGVGVQLLGGRDSNSFRPGSLLLLLSRSRVRSLFY